MNSATPDSAARRLAETAMAEDLISESAFAGEVARRGRWYFQLAATLCRDEAEPWGRRHYFQLITEADTTEAFLDDHGARYNRTFALLREKVASARGFALAGLRIAHLVHRLEGYFAGSVLSAMERVEMRASCGNARHFIQRSCVSMLRASLEEAGRLAIEVRGEPYPSDRYDADPVLRHLPRNIGHEELRDEEQKLAEVTSKFLQCCELFRGLGVRRIEEARERDRYLSANCTEESARVLEATVHNLQSAYDTHVKNTSLEADEPRLATLRGHASAALHLLEAVTCLTHFVERHEGTRGSERAMQLARLVDRSAVQDVTLNHLLFWAVKLMLSAQALAEELSPSFLDVQVLEIEIEDSTRLHARPAALIVGIVHRWGTPVQMEVEGKPCNAGSMLEMMIAIGSHPQARRLTFRGDVNPLQDIRRLFEAGLGESGLDRLPPELGYLRQN